MGLLLHLVILYVLVRHLLHEYRLVVLVNHLLVEALRDQLVGIDYEEIAPDEGENLSLFESLI